MISRTYFTETFYDMEASIAQRYAQAIREAWLTGKDFEGEKKQGFFLSMKGSQTARGGFQDKLYVGNIHRIENHLYWNDEELADDDEIVNVVVIDGPVTRDGDGCSYGSKDHRDQITYANTIPQVKGHIFIINTPGGAASARIDYEQAIADCREKCKPTVAWVDGMCCSAGQLVAALCDRTIVMNGKDTMGCIGTMCAFWAVPHDNVDRDGYRYIELVSVTSPDKNIEYREAAEGKYAKMQAELDKLGDEFRETVRQYRPLVKDEHLTGKTFDAADVMGALVDEVGDYARAIQAVFDLAGGTLKPAREITTVDEPGKGAQEPEEQAELATLNEQQKQAIANSKGELMMVEDGSVTAEKQSLFGPETVEVATPKNNEDMTEQEKKAAEVAEQPAANQEAQSPATEQPAEEAPATEAPAVEENEAPASEEEKPAEEEAPSAEQPAEEAPATEAPATDENETSTSEEEKPAEGEAPATEQPAEEAPATEASAAKENEASASEEEKPAEEEAPATEQPAEAPAQEAQSKLDQMTKALHSAEALVEERDKTIETLNAEKENLNSQLSEKATAIEALQKKVASLQAEVKELSEKPTPMVDAQAGVPADNGTGEAPKENPHQRIKPGMTYEEIRATQRKK